MNYMQLFAKGGSVSKEQNMKDVLKSIFTNWTDSQINEALQNGIKNYGSIDDLYQAMTDVLNNIDPNSSLEEAQSVISSLFSSEEPSRIFKCGGKLQQLVTKFGKGGGVDCGCGGIKLDGGGKTLPEGASRTITQRDTTDWYPFRNGMIKSVHPTNGDAPTYQVFDGTTLIAPKYSVAPKLENEIGIFARPFQYFGAARRITPETAAEYEEARQSTFNVPAKQPGGTIELTPLPGHDVDTRLTRRQARDLAALNQGYNGEQFQYAMDNAMNALRKQGLRGRELRERAREMAAGITPAETSFTINTPSVNLDTFDFNTNKGLPIYTNTATNVTRSFGDASTIREGDLRPVTPQKRKKQGVITVGPLTDGSRYYTDYVQKGNEPIYSYSEFRHELPVTQVIGNKSGYTRKGNEPVASYYDFNHELPETKIVGNRTGYVGKGNEPVYGYDDFVHELPNTYVIANKSGYTQKDNKPVYGYDDISHELPTTTVIGNKSGYIQKDTNPIYSYYDFNHELPETTITPENGILLPEVIKYGYRNVQTPVPVSRKQGGQIEKDITKSLKCGGKTKKKK